MDAHAGGLPGKKNGLFLLRRGEMMVSIMKQFTRISWLRVKNN